MASSGGEVKYHQNLLVGVNVVLLVLATASFVLRLYARRLSVARYWYDDVVMGFAMVFCWAISILNFVSLRYGFGKHAADVSDEDIKNYLIVLYIFFLLETAAVTLIKTGILILYWRIFARKQFRWAIYAVEAFVVASFLIGVFGFTFQCSPVDAFWDHSKQAKCIDQDPFNIAISVFFLASDIIIYIMPMPIVWGLHTSTRRKVELSFVFLLGGVVCISGIFRLIAISKINVLDITWSNVAGALLNMVESLLGFVSANIPLMGPLFNRLRGKTVRSHPSNYPTKQPFDNNNNNNNNNKNTSSLRQNFRGADDFERIYDDQGHLIGKGSVLVSAGPVDAEAEAYEVGLPMHGITVKTDVEQRIESRDDLDEAVAPWQTRAA
ncbi:hypothetical protein MMC08_007584 [Hypocenomyce scalaris]|nr:hypothetical protein [Hypocenomyce scalaris]